MRRKVTVSGAGAQLSQPGQVVRSIRTNGFFRLGGYQYYLGKHFAQRSEAMRFDPEGMALTCQPEDSEETIRLPAQGVTKAELMGELAALQALPTYQLALLCVTNGTPSCNVTNSARLYLYMSRWSTAMSSSRNISRNIFGIYTCISYLRRKTIEHTSNSSRRAGNFPRAKIVSNHSIGSFYKFDFFIKTRYSTYKMHRSIKNLLRRL